MLKKYFLYFHTCRHLKTRQILWRIYLKLHKIHWRKQAAPPSCIPIGHWVPPIAVGRILAGENEFTFLHETHRCQMPADWNHPERSKLYLYNLHYFDWLRQPDLPPATKNLWMERWTEENPPIAGNGWEPYPISLRVVNWIKWGLQEPLSEKILDSLALQLRILEQQIEYHLLANHLLANAKALIFGGLFFASPEGGRWYELGIDIYRQELPEQILRDGGHIERSPMYHAIILEDILDIINLFYAMKGKSRQLPLDFDRIACRMLHWLQVMTMPDGDITFFNDAAFGIAPRLESLIAYANRLGLNYHCSELPAVCQLADSGYCRVACGPWLLWTDTAPLGPDYQPGHAHADLLSFELCYRNKRLLVNSGTSCYTGPDRQLERATSAHNTLTLAGQNSAEVWKDHRVARRGKIVDCSIASQILTATHDGFLRQFGCLHRRCWRWTPEAIFIEDRVSGASQLPVELYFHWHPDWQVETHGNSAVVLRHVDGTRCQIHFEKPPRRLEVRKSFYRCGFGRRIPNVTIVAEQDKDSMELQIVTRILAL